MADWGALFIQGWQSGQAMREAKRKALLEQGAIEREVLGAVTPIAKFDPDAANELYEQYTGKPGPFKKTMLGEKVSKTPPSKGLFGTETTILPGREVRTGGVEVSPETKHRVNTLKALEEMGLPISPEMKTQYITGVKADKPPKPTEAEIKLKALKDAGATDREIIKAFGGYTRTQQPQIIEVGVKGKPLLRQRARYDFDTGKLTRIGTPYQVGSGEATTAKTLNNLASDFQQAMGRYYAATRGVGQFIPDPNKERVAQEALRQAAIIAERYQALGGNLKDLGIESQEELELIKAGISEEDIQYTMEQHGLSREEVIRRVLQKKKK